MSSILKKNIGQDTIFSKEGFVFIMIRNNDVYMLNKDSGFEKVSEDVFSSKDKFLYAATKSYWIASGNIFSNSRNNLI